MKPIPRPDWRTTIAVIAALVAALVWSIVAASSNEQAKQQSINGLQQNVTALTTNQAVLLHEVTGLTDDIHGLTQDVNGLVAYTKAVGDREQAILAYLHQHGIKLPARLITVIPAPAIVQAPSPRVVTGQASKSHGKGHKK